MHCVPPVQRRRMSITLRRSLSSLLFIFKHQNLSQTLDYLSQYLVKSFNLHPEFYGRNSCLFSLDHLRHQALHKLVFMGMHSTEFQIKAQSYIGLTRVTMFMWVSQQFCFQFATMWETLREEHEDTKSLSGHPCVFFSKDSNQTMLSGWARYMQAGWKQRLQGQRVESGGSLKTQSRSQRQKTEYQRGTQWVWQIWSKISGVSSCLKYRDLQTIVGRRRTQDIIWNHLLGKFVVINRLLHDVGPWHNFIDWLTDFKTASNRALKSRVSRSRLLVVLLLIVVQVKTIS